MTNQELEVYNMVKSCGKFLASRFETDTVIYTALLTLWNDEYIDDDFAVYYYHENISDEKRRLHIFSVTAKKLPVNLSEV